MVSLQTFVVWSDIVQGTFSANRVERRPKMLWRYSIKRFPCRLLELFGLSQFENYEADMHFLHSEARHPLQSILACCSNLASKRLKRHNWIPSPFYTSVTMNCPWSLMRMMHSIRISPSARTWRSRGSAGPGQIKQLQEISTILCM